MEYTQEHEIDNQIQEIDLLELIMSDLNTTNQYLIFHGSNDEIYAMNVSKIIEVLVYKDLEMVKNGGSDSYIKATAHIRDYAATIINFDEWFGNKTLEDSQYEYLILAGFGGHNLGIMIKDVEYIVTIDSQNMKDNSKNNPKTNFISKVKIDNQEQLCTIFDCDKLLLDIFQDAANTNDIATIETPHTIQSDKTIFFADDSRFIRKMVTSLFEKFHLQYKVFHNGKELLDELIQTKPEDVALIITDIEMPIMDGFHLLKKIQEQEIYDDINIIVHTNISNFIIQNSLLDLGSVQIIGKINMHQLTLGISRYIR